MGKSSKGNLLVVFIVIIAMSAMIFSFLAFMGVRLKESGSRVSESEAFYAADAGLNKAFWYLATPTAQGGHGLSWRTTNYHESFGSGGYYISVMDYSTNEVFIISTGEAKGLTKTVSQLGRIGGLPAAFDYAVFCNAGVSFSGGSTIQGDLYVNGNTEFSKNSSVTSGYVYHPVGATLSGQGTWTDGGEPTPLPTFPSFNPSYYNNLITVAGGQPSGNVSYNGGTVNLNGGTVYVNGNVTISGSTTFVGPGTIVSTGKISQSGDTYSSGDVKFISSDEFKITGNTYTSGATYFSATDIDASGNTRVTGSNFLTTGSVKLSGNINLSGMVYAESGSSFISGNPTIRGSLVAASFSTFTGNNNVFFDESTLPTDLPPGFDPTTITPVKGSWKEY